MQPSAVATLTVAYTCRPRRKRKRKHPQKMLAGVEEAELEPCDLFTYLGTLIIEGRVPGLVDRGFVEGPHCPHVSGQSRHVCDLSSPECQRHEQLEKHMLLLWKNSIPLSVEVLLYPECCHNLQQQGKGVQVETSSAPETGPCVLLEQWTLHMLQRRLPDASIPPRGLIQAVRSFLHFSQLSAWLSLSRGKNNLNIHYRLCVPGEAFSSKFDQVPDYHSFPVANVGRSAMKIMVKSLPRCGTLPQVPCLKHGLGAINSAFNPMPIMFPPGSPVLVSEVDSYGEKLRKSAKESTLGASSSLADVPLRSYRATPVESSLGDSLLDPPQSLQMYPKRYQSPSRCGSPSLEAPEHLLFRPGPSTRRESEPRPRLNSNSRDRSRPQRRPVVERFLKKEYGECSINPPTLPRDRFSPLEMKKFPLEEGCRSTETSLKNTLLYPGYKMQLPDEEMQMVLNRLRNRYPSVTKVSQEEPKDTEESYLFKNLWLKQESLKRINEQGEQVAPNLVAPMSKTLKKKNEYSGHQSNGKEPHRQFHEISSSSQQKPSCSSSSSSFSPSSFSSLSFSSSSFSSPSFPTFLCNHSKTSDFNPLVASSPFTESQSKGSKDFISNLSPDLNDQSMNVLLDILDKGCNRAPFLDLDPQSNTLNEERSLEEASDSNNFMPIDGLLQDERTSGDDLNRCSDNQNIYIGQNAQVGLLYQMLTSKAHTTLHDLEQQNIDKNVAIPSSEDKLKFRRSLDSATSMVFHQNTGLPLTSSPAPIRKSGTCFDFDSSLTSVSAIKKALFEKEPEIENCVSPKTVLSTSAPSSTTTNNLLGNFEESVLNGRLEPVSTVEGFTAEIGASGSFCPRHRTLPVTVFFYTLHDIHKVTSPYLGHINLGRKGYYVPKKGTVQVTLFNPHRTVVKMFVVRYNLSEMPSNCQTFLRQRTLYMPTDAKEDDVDARKWLRYLIHLRFASSKSGKIYLHTDVRMIVFRKSDVDAATIHGQRPYELRSFTQEPLNPKFSPCK